MKIRKITAGLIAAGMIAGTALAPNARAGLNISAGAEEDPSEVVVTEKQGEIMTTIRYPKNAAIEKVTDEITYTATFSCPAGYKLDKLYWMNGGLILKSRFNKWEEVTVGSGSNVTSTLTVSIDKFPYEDEPFEYVNIVCNAEFTDADGGWHLAAPCGHLEIKKGPRLDINHDKSSGYDGNNCFGIAVDLTNGEANSFKWTIEPDDGNFEIIGGTEDDVSSSVIIKELFAPLVDTEYKVYCEADLKDKSQASSVSEFLWRINLAGTGSKPDPEPAWISFEPEYSIGDIITISKGQSKEIKAVAHLPEGSKDITYKWSSDDPEVTLKNSDTDTVVFSIDSDIEMPFFIDVTVSYNDASGAAQTPVKGFVTVRYTIAQSEENIIVYRLYNSVNQEHLFTTDTNEVRVLVKDYGWNYEGSSWSAPTTGAPVYRLYCSATNAHLYTTDTNERDTLLQNPVWSIDNGGEPLFYSDAGETNAIYRVYNEGIQRHLLTTNKAEYDILVSNGWKGEGVKFFCSALGDPEEVMP